MLPIESHSSEGSGRGRWLLRKVSQSLSFRWMEMEDHQPDRTSMEREPGTNTPFIWFILKYSGRIRKRWKRVKETLQIGELQPRLDYKRDLCLEDSQLRKALSVPLSLCHTGHCCVCLSPELLNSTPALFSPSVSSSCRQTCLLTKVNHL